MNIVQKLSLNKHPKDVQDLSLVLAQNVKVSKDMSCITNEEGIRKNTYIKSFLENYYKKDYKVLGIIPCNNELIIITSAISNISSASIFRYKEDTSLTKESIKCIYDKLIYNGGKYIGTFTYNVEESLILVLSEYDADINVPLKVINLGNFDDDNIENDLHLNDGQLSLIPEVKLPSFDFSYVKGRAYKGWYFVFIRYKINSVDYTQWYNFGSPIYIDEYTIKNIVKEYNYEERGGFIDNNVLGFSDTFSDDIDIVNNTFNIQLNNLDNNYNIYQLGFICSNKNYIKSFKTDDINIDNDYYLFNNTVKEHNVSDFITSYYNYFNVKNLINYKNRLYISNYLEKESDNIDKINNLQEYINGVNIELYSVADEFDWNKEIIYDNINEVQELKYDNGILIENNTKNRTLIPDGVYNFYIHFVDKYGKATKGYKLNPPKSINDGDDKYKTLVPFIINDDTRYLIVPSDLTVGNLINHIETNEVIVAKGFSNTSVIKDSINNEDIKTYIESQYGEILNSDIHKYIYLSQIFNDARGWQTDTTTGITKCLFGNTINTNGDVLWKIPSAGLVKGQDNKYITYKYRFDVKINNIPNGFIGYYISYEKYETSHKLTGYLTRRNANVATLTTDNGLVDLVPNNNIVPDNYQEESIKQYMCLYSSYFDIADSIDLSFNSFKIIGNESRLPSEIANPLLKGNEIQYPINANEYFKLSGYATTSLYPLLDYKLAIANDQINGRNGVGTCLLVNDKYRLFSDNTKDNITTYLISVYNYNNNLYTNKIKTLIRITDIIYDTNNHKCHFYNGNLTIDGVLVYNDNGYAISVSTEKNVYKSVTIRNGTYEYFKDGDTSSTSSTQGVTYVEFPLYSDVTLESKVFNNKPKTGYNFTSNINNEDQSKITKEASSIVEPINSIDLFKNPQGTVDDFYPVTNTNYIEEDLNVIQFDKTVRRSDVIQDETRLNAWRKFPIEGYKNITENKGKITKLIGIGYMFLVHTEHSLFMFDTNNLLQAVNTDVQLVQPDAFDVNYKEVFTSDLGFGGLQDNKAGIVDTFGYIFYNNDANRFYHFDNGQLAIIDNDIIEWLYKVKPYNVRFANDKINNRLLIKMSTDSISVEQDAPAETFILSYNYNLKSFISFHTYTFDEAYNTKNGLYLRCNDHNNCSLHQFKELHNDKYGSFDNVRNSLGTVINQQSKIGIIVNPSFDVIKYLEYFSYKLSKIKDASELDLVYSPIKEFIEPFSGNLLKVYNNLTNTGELDISVNEEISKNIYAHFDKPYWHLGNWNYNYLRNNINQANNISSDYLSRIVGNYFVIEFTFNNDDNKLIEFEGLTYKVSQ